MSKKCIICDAEAGYKIKDTTEYYCPSCAEESFADISLLVKIAEEAQKLKAFVEDKSHGDNSSGEDQDIQE